MQVSATDSDYTEVPVGIPQYYMETYVTVKLSRKKKKTVKYNTHLNKTKCIKYSIMFSVTVQPHHTHTTPQCRQPVYHNI